MPEEQCLHFLRLLSTTAVPHLFHHSCYFVADMDGEPKAGLGGYDTNAFGNAALFRALPEVFRHIRGGSLSGTRNGTPPRILSCIPEPLEDLWMIDSVGAVPESRRQGIVSKLLETVLQRGRDNGFPLAQINIYIGNTAAQRLYEKQGFAVIDQFETHILNQKSAHREWLVCCGPCKARSLATALVRMLRAWGSHIGL